MPVDSESESESVTVQVCTTRPPCHGPCDDSEAAPQVVASLAVPAHWQVNQPPATIIMILSPTSFTILLGPTSKRRTSMVLPQRVELWSGTSTVLPEFIPRRAQQRTSCQQVQRRHLKQVQQWYLIYASRSSREDVANACMKPTMLSEDKSSVRHWQRIRTKT